MNMFNKNVNFEREVTRVHTGIEELDGFLGGGLPKNSVTLISGTPGSGKSIMCFHYILEGLQNGENCLYLTSDERIQSVIKQASELDLIFGQLLKKVNSNLCM